MTTQTLVKKLNREVSTLRRDMAIVKNLLLAGYRDPEGEYKKSFVKKMLARAKEKPKYRFTTRQAFLKHVYGGKK